MQAFPQGEPGSPTVAGAPEALTVPPAANTEPARQERRCVQGAPSGSSPSKTFTNARATFLQGQELQFPRLHLLQVLPVDTTRLTAGA